MRLLAFTLPLLLLGAVPTRAQDGPADPAQWGQWRGPLGNGVAVQADPPVEWSEEKNLRWKTSLPGLGHSSPVVWNDRVFLTTAIEEGEPVDPPVGRRPGEHDNILQVRKTRFAVLCIDRKSGALLWQSTVRAHTPHEARHKTSSYASASPVTDGTHLFAFFGSHGLYCLDYDGKVKWQKDFGDMHTKHAHGEGASPALFGETLVVVWDHEGEDFVVALDTATGEERWRRKREEPTSWSSPHILVHEGRPQVVVAATNRIRSYELATGKVLWECGGLSLNVVSAPVSAEGMVIAGSSYEKRTILGIRLAGAAGDLTGTKQVAWIKRRDTPYVPSLLLHEGLVYFLRHYQGVLTCLDARTGETVYARTHLGGLGNIYSSPVAVGNRLYFTSLDGATLVMTAGPNPEALALNRLDDSFSASPALVGKDLLLRGERHLYCLRESP